MSTLQLGLLFAFSAPFLVALLIARRHWVSAGDAASNTQAADDGPEVLDVEVAVRQAAEAVHNLARALFVHIELAVRPGLMAWADPNAVRIALEAALRTAIRATQGGQVLVTGTAHRGQLHIRIIDDGTNTDPWSHENGIREAQTLLVSQGGSIAVDARSGRRTTIMVRLPLRRDFTGRKEAPWLPGQAA